MPFPVPLAPELRPIAEKALAAKRLDEADGLTLFTTPDLAGLCALANHVKERITGNRAFYINNQHINYSNICVDDCKFCAFGKKPSQDGAYEFSLDEVFARADQAAHRGARELHIVGGLHPTLPYSYYTDMLRGLKSRHPQIHLKCFTAVEIDFLASLYGRDVRETLEDLRSAGLDSMPGGGSEMFSERVRQILCPNKITPERWLEIHRIAHRLGIRSTCTMLFGHVEKPEERVDHILRLRALQDETRGFTAFVPLAFHPENTAFAHLPGPGGQDMLRTIAAGRLLFDNIEHVKVYWIMFTLPLAQVGLRCGADDLDGTVVEERVYHMAGAATPQGVEESDLCRMILDAGRTPVRRDSLYQEIPDPSQTAPLAV